MRSLDELVNYALTAKLGEPPLDLVDSTTSVGRTVLAVWPASRQAVFRKHSFNELVRRAVLPSQPDAPAYGFMYAFLLPADLITVLEVNTPTNYTLRPTEYRVEGNTLLANFDPSEGGLWLRYTADVQDVSMYSPSLTECLACYLGAQLVRAINQDATERDRLQFEFDTALRDAKTVDSREDSGSAFYEDDWVLARHRRR